MGVHIRKKMYLFIYNSFKFVMWCAVLRHYVTYRYRYFLLVVAVYAHSKNKEFLVCANVSERIIVRVSQMNFKRGTKNVN